VAGLTPMALAASMRFSASLGTASISFSIMRLFYQVAWSKNYTVEK
jgi:hypothetical protein